MLIFCKLLCSGTHFTIFLSALRLKLDDMVVYETVQIGNLLWTIQFVSLETIVTM